MVSKEEFIVRALQAGVYGCVLKTSPPTELVKAIRAAYAGEFWVARKLLTRVVETLRQRVEELQGGPSGMWQVLVSAFSIAFATTSLQGALSGSWEVLSDREHEVVMWAVQGMTNVEIATQLGISAKTVKTH